jgi:hypothetical protein
VSTGPLEELVQDSKSREHRMRVLEHQAKLAAEAATLMPGRSGAQRNIPLIVEVTGGASHKPLPPRRTRRKPQPKQPGFDGL